MGSAETTLLKLTSAYSLLLMEENLLNQYWLIEFKIVRGNTIFNNDKRECINCDQISYLRNDYPEIKNTYSQIFSPETAFKWHQCLEGVVQRGTAKKLRDLNLNIAGKTGTTNKNTDAWFIGFTSNLVSWCLCWFWRTKNSIRKIRNRI